MYNKETVIQDFRASAEELKKALSSFPVALFNNKPATGGWSAGDVAAHLLALEKNINHIISTPGEAANRPIDEKVQLVGQVFADFTKKYNSPSFIKPTGNPVDQQEVIQELSREKEKLTVHIAQEDLAELCTGFPHNRLGTFTKLEWVYFTIYHTRRHIRQVEQLRQLAVGR